MGSSPTIRCAARCWSSSRSGRGSPPIRDGAPRPATGTSTSPTRWRAPSTSRLSPSSRGCHFPGSESRRREASRSAAGPGDRSGPRRSAGAHLVRRPTAELDTGRVASATIESAAENLTDSLVAPALFFLAGGLAGAAVYRVVNTADAMFGYRTGPLEYFGKIAARLDDLLNLIPARLAGLSLVAGAALVAEKGRGALACLRRDRRRTASPN